jgi:hypothetical protein
MNKYLTVFKALLLGMEINLPIGVVKLFQRGQILPIDSTHEVELTEYFFAYKMKNITDGSDYWVGLKDFSIVDLMNEVDKLSDKEFSIITANVALNLTKPTRL